MRPKILVFASGTATGGGSGFENLVKHSRTYAEGTQTNAEKDIFDYEIAGVVSNHENGGVRLRADALGIPFIHFKSDSNYSNVLQNYGIEAEWFALSGWLKMVKGLDPARTFNIHPALLSLSGGKFGGERMYGERVHQAVKEALEKGEIEESGVSMHFVTDEYDRGPVFFEYRIPLKAGMSAEEIKEKVNRAEHEWQPKITTMVVHGEISWDGTDSKSLKVPDGYRYLPHA